MALVVAGGQTPEHASGGIVRDKLAINPEESLGFEDKERQREHLNSLKKSLSKLPAPKNDYEIVLPDEGGEGVGADRMDSDGTDYVGEQFDVMDEDEVRYQKRMLQKQKCKWTLICRK